MKDREMDIEQTDAGKFVIRHQGKVVSGLLGTTNADGPVKAGPFETEREAEHWADMWIDDQVFDSDNHFAPPLEYRAA
jgi:hypothetical protein